MNDYVTYFAMLPHDCLLHILTRRHPTKFSHHRLGDYLRPNENFSLPKTHVIDGGEETPSESESTVTVIVENKVATGGRFQLGALHAPELNCTKGKFDVANL
jgi:hypothetical protein